MCTTSVLIHIMHNIALTSRTSPGQCTTSTLRDGRTMEYRKRLHLCSTSGGKYARMMNLPGDHLSFTAGQIMLCFYSWHLTAYICSYLWQQTLWFQRWHWSHRDAPCSGLFAGTSRGRRRRWRSEVYTLDAQQPNEHDSDTGKYMMWRSIKVCVFSYCFVLIKWKFDFIHWM